MMIGGAGASKPDAPTIGTATATGSSTATVTFTAPAVNGGSPITSYTATSSPSGFTGTLSQAGSGTITVSGLNSATSYTFTVTATNAVGTSVASSASNSITTEGPPGQQEYTTAGSYSWPVPANVTSVSWVMVGAHQSGTGGALSYYNNYAVSTGSTYGVQVGGPGAPSNRSFWGGEPLGYAGSGADKAGYFGTPGFGGNPSRGGGGAGGYAGNGGNGTATGTGQPGSGGGGGGGGGYLGGTGQGYGVYFSSGGGGGGGVGIYGQGPDGYGGPSDGQGTQNVGNNYGGGGGGGSGGNAGTTATGMNSPFPGGNFGGGNSAYGGTSRGGAVRIIWPGTARQFPSTRTANE